MTTPADPPIQELTHVQQLALELAAVRAELAQTRADLAAVTPEDRASAIRLPVGVRLSGTQAEELLASIAGAIRAAVLEERAACAAVARSVVVRGDELGGNACDDNTEVREAVARAIEARPAFVESHP